MKNKKLIGIILAGLASGVSVAIGLFFLIINVSRDETIRPDVQDKSIEVVAKTVMPSASARDYENDSGFLFQHPADVAIEEHDVDAQGYADLELLSTRADGSITVVAMDSDIANLDEWEQKYASFSQGATSKDVDLDGVTGRELKTDNRIITGMLDRGALFEFEVLSEENMQYWTSVYEMLVDTFAFVQPPPDLIAPAGNSGGGGGDIIFEGEEIIE